MPEEEKGSSSRGPSNRPRARAGKLDLPAPGRGLRAALRARRRGLRRQGARHRAGLPEHRVPLRRAPFRAPRAGRPLRRPLRRGGRGGRAPPLAGAGDDPRLATQPGQAPGRLRQAPGGSRRRGRRAGLGGRRERGDRGRPDGGDPDALVLRRRPLAPPGGPRAHRLQPAQPPVGADGRLGLERRPRRGRFVPSASGPGELAFDERGVFGHISVPPGPGVETSVEAYLHGV